MERTSRSTPAQEAPVGLHVAIILDGNGRWARARGLPRSAGHRSGTQAVRRIVNAAPELGVGTLSLFALSSANWRRPRHEVDGILANVRKFLDSAVKHCVRLAVRLEVFGRRDRLPDDLVAAIDAAEKLTRTGTRMLLRIAVDYSAREAIVSAARRFHVECARYGASVGFARLLAGPSAAGDVDLLIRTGGEQRLSDFLLWECAWAEILFVRRAWPEFRASDLRRALCSFRARERRYGALSEPGSSGVVQPSRRNG